MSRLESLVIGSNTSWSVVNFRAELVAELRERGFRVQVVAPADRFSDRIEAMGAEFHPLPLDARGTSPVGDAMLLVRYRQLLARLRPRAFLGFTAKPNIFGGLAAQSLGVPVVNNIAGLGTAFVSRSWVTSVVEALYRLSLARSHKVFFQNGDDMATFVRRGLVREERAALLAGSGVNLARFAPVPRPAPPEGECRFLLQGRLLWEKGVGIYAEAARIVRSRHPKARFGLLGPVLADNPAAVGPTAISTWASEGTVDYLGEADDVRPCIAGADCVVLPSYYREGVPRSLLEAAAMAKPIITTDMPGCRSAVEDGVTGYLCKPCDAEDLARKMMQMIAAPPEARSAMGEAGRRKMQREFDQRSVLSRYVGCLQEIGAGAVPQPEPGRPVPGPAAPGRKNPA